LKVPHGGPGCSRIALRSRRRGSRLLRPAERIPSRATPGTRLRRRCTGGLRKETYGRPPNDNLAEHARNSLADSRRLLAVRNDPRSRPAVTRQAPSERQPADAFEGSPARPPDRRSRTQPRSLPRRGRTRDTLTRRARRTEHPETGRARIGLLEHLRVARPSIRHRTFPDAEEATARQSGANIRKAAVFRTIGGVLPTHSSLPPFDL
jgi:hypothetical protein